MWPFRRGDELELDPMKKNLVILILAVFLLGMGAWWIYSEIKRVRSLEKCEMTSFCVQRANDILSRNVDGYFATLEMCYLLNKKKHGPKYEWAQSVRSKHKQLLDQMYLVRGAIDVGDYKGIPDSWSSTIRNNVEGYRKWMLQQVFPRYKDRVMASAQLRTMMGLTGDAEVWELSKLGSGDRECDLLVLDRIVSEILCSEAEIFRMLGIEFSEDDFFFDKYRVFVCPEKTEVSVGEYYNADVGIALYNDEWTFEVVAGTYVDTGSNIVTGPLVKGTCTAGVGRIVIPTRSPGMFSYGGTATLRREDGSKKVYPFSGSYTVTEK